MKSLKISSGLSTAFSAAVFIGVACFSYAFLKDPNRAWHAYIMNYYFFACLGLGGLFFAATQHLTSAGWSATVRRIPEAFHAWFLPALILAIPIVVAGKTVYEWTHHEEVMNDHLLHMKSAYLNIPFFVVRLVLLFAVWYFIGGRLVKNSLKQDQTGDLTITHENVRFSAIYMPLFALLFTFFSVDLIMSMDPHWYSTMFGVNCFANLFLSTIAVTIIFVVHMKRAGYFGESINENHFHALGLLQFAFTVFYAYIAFCQFMLIWYGNMPEETVYYLKRYENGWSVVAYGVIFGKFLIPFLAQLPREAKRRPNYLVKVSYWLVAACWLDLFWMVMPSYSKSPFVPWVEIGVFVGFAGGFGYIVTKFLSKVPVQPQKDPRVHEALHLHS